MRVSGKHNDLENVGPSFRHHTFFEMLGNFSFGDYFKRDAIPFAWSLLTDEWKLPKDRLFATVFRGEPGVPRDDEAIRHLADVPAGRAHRRAWRGDNFWSMGDTGPCGRCSEIYYFRGATLPCAEEAAGRPCRGLECDCDRYVEIWNNVFMEFDRQPGRRAQAAAGAVDRYRDGPRTRHRRPPGEGVHLRHGRVHSPARGASAHSPARPTGARWSRPTCRCASWPTTCAR